MTLAHAATAANADVRGFVHEHHQDHLLLQAEMSVRLKMVPVYARRMFAVTGNKLIDRLTR